MLEEQFKKEFERVEGNKVDIKKSIVIACIVYVIAMLFILL